MSPKARRILYIAIAAIACLWGLSWIAGWRDPSAREASDRRASESGEASGHDGPSARSDERGPDAGIAELAEIARAPVRLSTPDVARDPLAVHGAIEGRVVAYASGHPIAGAELTFEHGGATESVRTDSSGAFSLDAREEGTYVLAVATADDFLPFAPEWGHSPIRWEARPGVRLSGVVITLVDAVEYTAVVTANGSPVANASVHVFGLERGERALAPLSADTTTNADGEARFIAPDRAVVEASHPDHGRGRASIDSSAQASHHISIELARRPEFTGDQRIAGLVVDRHDAPIEGALITARFAALHAFGDLHPTLEATSDAEGRFTLEGADAGRYLLTANAEGHAHAVVGEIAAGREDVRVVLGEGGRLAVRVRDEHGAPVAALTVVVTRHMGPLVEETLAIASAYDAEGEVTVTGLPPVDVEVTAVAPGFAPSAPHPALVRADRVETIDLSLERGGRIVGRVVSGQTPLAGARVTLESRIGEGASAVPLEGSALSEPDGSFTLSGVPAGRRSIVVWAADHDGRLRDGIEVVDGAAIDVGAIDLAPVAEGETPRLEMAGIGAVLSAEGDALVIGRVVEGGGAAEIGLVPGDAVLEVEGVSVASLGFEGTIGRIRGPEGTFVVLSVRRADGRIEVLSVPRRRIRA